MKEGRQTEILVFESWCSCFACVFNLMCGLQHASHGCVTSIRCRSVLVILNGLHLWAALFLLFFAAACLNLCSVTFKRLSANICIHGSICLPHASVHSVIAACIDTIPSPAPLLHSIPPTNRSANSGYTCRLTLLIRRIHTAVRPNSILHRPASSSSSLFFLLLLLPTTLSLLSRVLCFPNPPLLLQGVRCQYNHPSTYAYFATQPTAHPRYCFASSLQLLIT